MISSFCLLLSCMSSGDHVFRTSTADIPSREVAESVHVRIQLL